MTRTYRSIDAASQRTRLLARAHREAIKELWVIIPWAPPAIVRELKRRYREGFQSRGVRS